MQLPYYVKNCKLYKKMLILTDTPNIWNWVKQATTSPSPTFQLQGIPLKKFSKTPKNCKLKLENILKG
jgi:hypothetical protein